ncbi:hypothetical protein F5Y04DRAFT_254274 [Hypomontagnella monticulosa]|nr:hypothetical protein F5Y04DRAFT_254274 [Hypomontagnella monticulosa]
MDQMASDQASLSVPRPGIGGAYDSFATFDDPRSSSTQSLISAPSDYEESGRRKLLVIYIHGFMGSDASFQSFPAHVHSYLKLALSDTHVIHTKIYPRYKTYKILDVARDNFSRWLAPHESPTTDVVLIGHSMGGLLAADVALMPSRNQYQPGYFLHRILGTVGLDAPYLGLHASVITAGIASLFRPKPNTADLPEESIPEDESNQSLYSVTSGGNTSIYSDPSIASQQSLPSPRPSGSPIPHTMTFDPNFNPSFTNDVRVQDRGWWRNIVHFVEKHNSEGLIDAATNHITSHLEFGGCLIDGNGLKTRYENIRKLEDVDDLKHHGFPHVPPQVRFVQYYTVCHGYPKKRKSQDASRSPKISGSSMATPSTPQISVQDHSNSPSPQNSTKVRQEDTAHQEAFSSDEEGPGLQLLDPEPMLEEPEPIPDLDIAGEGLKDSKEKVTEESSPESNPPGSGDDLKAVPPQNPESSLPTKGPTNEADGANDLSEAIASLGLDLPEIPEPPTKPELPNLDQYTDKDARKQAEKEAKRLQKDYDKLVKDRDKAIKERQKIFDKRKKKLVQETEKREKEEQKRRKKEEALAAAASSSSNSEEGASKIASNPDAPMSEHASMMDSDPNMMSPPPMSPGQSKGNAKPPKTPKERKFCNIHKVNGQVDPKWVKIFMKDMDQVAAHTSLFFRGEHYERFVGDLGETIVNWVQDDMTKRAILEMG